MAKSPPSPLNFLQCRENFQICKFKVLRVEQRLMAALACKTLADLETAMLQERSKAGSQHAALIAEYLQLHQELGAADILYSAAVELQRKRVTQADAAQEQVRKDLAALEC
jgi:hypothetical protein